MHYSNVTTHAFTAKQKMRCCYWILAKKGSTRRAFSEKNDFLSNIQTILGEEQISNLKQSVKSASSRFDEATRNVESARIIMRGLQEKYEEHQKEHMAILMRRENWTESDIQRFAQITSNEVRVKRELEESRKKLQRYEEEQGLKQVNYMDAIRVRYHEEQLWQDKWRVISTYGTWALIGLNSLIFVGGQLFQQVREEKRMIQMNNLLNEKLVSLGAIVDRTNNPLVYDIETSEDDDDSSSSSASSNISTMSAHDQVQDEGDVDTSTYEYIGEIEEANADTNCNADVSPTRTGSWVINSFEMISKTMAESSTWSTLHLPSAAAGATVTLLIVASISKR